MREMWVRGVFFVQVLDFVRQDRGRTAYELLGRDIDSYRPEEKYDFGEFAELLSRVRLVSPADEDYIARIARETMAREAAWKNLFRRMDPRSVFTSNQRQTGRQNIADYEPLEAAEKLVRLRMSMWTENREHQALWADFYRGRLEGILELMGRKGSVKQVRELGNGVFIYTITWN